MIAISIGILSGLLVILVLIIFRKPDQITMYGLILSGIGFLYVGFAWTNARELIVNSVQAIVFVFIACYGMRKNTYILAAGYILHGCWDMAYSFFNTPALIPPHYDLFCLSIDFTMAAYIIILSKKLTAQ